jgi:hypothetical protein
MVAKQMATIETVTSVHLAIRIMEEHKEVIILTILATQSSEFAQEAF